jgi:hypothetical protein
VVLAMLKTPKEKFTEENLRYLKIAISLALTGTDIEEMPKTKIALNELYEKIERIKETINP